MRLSCLSIGIVPWWAGRSQAVVGIFCLPKIWYGLRRQVEAGWGIRRSDSRGWAVAGRGGPLAGGLVPSVPTDFVPVVGRRHVVEIRSLKVDFNLLLEI